MWDIIIDLQSSDAWKILLTIAINFIFSKDTKEDPTVHSKSDNIKLKFYNDANEVVNKLFESLRLRYQENQETSMKGSDFIFDSVKLMYCKYHKVDFRHGGSYIDSLDWIENKKAAINPKNQDDKCFQIY